MKKILSILFALTLCLCLATTALASELPARAELLWDGADLLSFGEEAELREKLQRLSDLYQADIAVITLPSMDGAYADDMVEQLYDGLDYGRGTERDGVLLMLSMAEREYRILSNGAAADAITLNDIDDISNDIVSDLSGGWYADAFETYADQCGYYLDGYRNGYPFEAGKSLIIALVIGLVAGLITVLILRGQLKTVKQQTRANDYVKAGTMQVTTANDIFLYRNVSRTRKQSNSSGSGRSGGSRNVGGGRF